MKELAVSILGLGMMGRARSVAYDNLTRLYPDCPIKPVLSQAFVLPNEVDAANALGWRANTNMRSVIYADDTEYVDICLPNAMHYAATMMALDAGKHVFCEKPLAISLNEAREMTEAAEARPDLLNSVHYTYRRVPANIFARQLVRQNRFGRLLEARSYYNQHWGVGGNWGGWRFDSKAGGGTAGDLGSHAIDMLYFVTGKRPERLCSMQFTHVNERVFTVDYTKEDGTVEKKQELRKVEVDDATRVMYYLPDGAVGTLSCTRYAQGTENTQGYEFWFEHGAIRWCYDDLDYLEIYDSDDPQRGWKRVLCSKNGFAYQDTLDNPDVGYRDLLSAGCYENMRAIAKIDPVAPIASFRDAYDVDRTLEAIRLSAKNEAWIRLDEVK